MVDEVILQHNELDAREVPGKKSTYKETIGFQRGMDALLSTDVIIKRSLLTVIPELQH